jgi:hypothetical protein
MAQATQAMASIASNKCRVVMRFTSGAQRAPF